MSISIKQALTEGQQSIFHSDSAALDAELILLHTLNTHRNILFTDPTKCLTQDQYALYKELLQRREYGEPVAYIIGEQGFWDLMLNVAPHTLIPRGDTESLIDWVLEQGLQPKRILDLGTGTGAIALALAKEFSHAQVIGVDLIPQAVELANSNKLKNNINNVQFLQSSWFENVPPEPYDLIVSNPPYIDELDEHLSQGDVRFEPASALIASQQGLSDLYWIAQQAQQYLTQGGCLLMEHGWQQAEPVSNYLQQQGYDKVGSGRDLAGQWRFSFGFKSLY
ncbi:MAG: peptide chain release factor N(5)-glutamine methyltransferase [Bermanella sp.]